MLQLRQQLSSIEMTKTTRKPFQGSEKYSQLRITLFFKRTIVFNTN